MCVRRAAAALVLLALLFAGCGGEGGAGQDPPQAQEQAEPAAGAEVLVQGFRYQPASLEVPAGTSVTWTNNDDINHTVTAGAADAPDLDVFDLPLQEAGTTVSHTFDEPGTIEYFCAVHESMTATVVVTD